MAFIPLPVGCKIRVQFTMNDVIVYTFHWAVRTTGTASIEIPFLTSMVNAVAGAYQVAVPTYLSTALSVIGINATAWDRANGPTYDYAGALPIVGTVAGDALPNSVALVASLRTGLSGRSFRGRNYLPGIPESQSAGNNVVAPFAGQMVTFMADLRTRITTATGTLVVASFQHNGVPRTTGVATPVATIQVNTRVDTQRRRLPA